MTLDEFWSLVFELYDEMQLYELDVSRQDVRDILFESLKRTTIESSEVTIDN